MSSLQKVKNKKMPRNHKGTKIHKIKIMSGIRLVKFCVLVFLWQKMTFRSRLQYLNSSK